MPGGDRAQAIAIGMNIKQIGAAVGDHALGAGDGVFGPEKQKLPSLTTETTGRSGKGRKCVVPFMVCITLVDVPGREAVKVERS